MPIASGWCYCKESHQDVGPCPGPLAVDHGGRTKSCQHCGTRYKLDGTECHTKICQRCHGKRMDQKKAS